jgi:hypothetical protein
VGLFAGVAQALQHLFGVERAHVRIRDHGAGGAVWQLFVHLFTQRFEHVATDLNEVAAWA